jgi:hypothetical protein
VITGYLIELVFTILGLVPSQRSATVVEQSISWNYTTWLNFVLGAASVALVVGFVRTGGLPMLKMMNASPDKDDSNGQLGQSPLDGH